MPKVMAVHHIFAKPVAELQEDEDFIVGQDRIYVPTALLQRWDPLTVDGNSVCRGVDRDVPAVQNASLFQVDVDRMRPARAGEAVANEPATTSS